MIVNILNHLAIFILTFLFFEVISHLKTHKVGTDDILTTCAVVIGLLFAIFPISM